MVELNILANVLRKIGFDAEAEATLMLEDEAEMLSDEGIEMGSENMFFGEVSDEVKHFDRYDEVSYAALPIYHLYSNEDSEEENYDVFVRRLTGAEDKSGITLNQIITYLEDTRREFTEDIEDGIPSEDDSYDDLDGKITADVDGREIEIAFWIFEPEESGTPTIRLIGMPPFPEEATIEDLSNEEYLAEIIGEDTLGREKFKTENLRVPDEELPLEAAEPFGANIERIIEPDEFLN